MISDKYIDRLKEATGYSFDIVLVLENHTSMLAMRVLETAERIQKQSDREIARCYEEANRLIEEPLGG